MFTWLWKYIYWALLEYRTKGSPDMIYDKIARDSYDKSVRYPKRVDAFKKLFNSLDLPESARVLDIACGTGAVEEALSYNDFQITGVDVSSEMLAVAREKFGKSKNITFIHGDILDQTFAPNTYDLIVMAYATRFIPEERAEEFAINVSSWLKPGGRWVCITSTRFLRHKELILFQKFTGYPRSFSILMHTPEKIKELFADKLTFEKEISFRLSLVKSIALVFRKDT